MKTTNNLITKIGAMTQSKWILPALMAFSIVSTLLVVSGCSSPHPH